MQENEDDLHLVSKTKLKAEANEKQMVGKRLIDLSEEKVHQLNLPEQLHDAILEAKRIKSNSALRRQVQYIGRLMREIDTAPITEQLSRWDGSHNEEKARFHILERWRDRLIEEAGSTRSEVLQAFLAEHPHAEVQQLRNLSRNAHKEQLANKPPKSSRELFKLLREIAQNSE